MFAFEAFFLMSMAYRCSFLIFLRLIRGFCSASNGLSVQFGCTWELSGFENGLTFRLLAVVAYQCKTRCVG